MRSIGRKLSESKCEQSVKFHDALDAGSMSTAAKRRASTCVMVTSSVFGLVGLGVRIPAYRLSGDTTLPGLGAVQAHWRQHLGQAAIEEPVLPRLSGGNVLSGRSPWARHGLRRCAGAARSAR